MSLPRFRFLVKKTMILSILERALVYADSGTAHPHFLMVCLWSNPSREDDVGGQRPGLNQEECYLAGAVPFRLRLSICASS